MDKPVTIITGSRKGIGRALCEHYLALGHIVIGCSRQPSDLVSGTYRHFEIDVNDETGVRVMFDTIRKEFGRIDHLINNAGIASMNHFMLTPLDTARRVFDTNFMGTLLFCQEASRMMSRAKRGRIVNFSTVATPLRLEGESIYAASKAAIVSLTQILARELGPLGVTVNAVGPTPIETDLIKGVPEGKMDALIGLQAIKRLGTFDDVANAVDFFLCERSDFITGQIIYLGGV